MELLGTTSVTVRLPNPIVKFIDESDYDNRSAFLRHWANVGWRVCRDPELSEALDWALEEAEKAANPVVTVEVQSYDSIVWPEGPQGPAVVSHWVPPSDELTSIRESQLEAMRNRVH